MGYPELLDADAIPPTWYQRLIAESRIEPTDLAVFAEPPRCLACGYTPPDGDRAAFHAFIDDARMLDPKFLLLLNGDP